MAVDVESSTDPSTRGSGALLWFELAQGTARDALVERLAQAYLIEADRPEQDVDRFLAELRGQGLLEEE